MPPEVGELHKRLRRAAGKWRSVEVQALVTICAREPDVYQVLPPSNGSPPKVLLRQEPTWFKGWVDMHSASFQGAEAEGLWEDLRGLLASVAADGARGDLNALAHKLYNGGSLPKRLRRLTLGEFLQVLNTSLADSKKVLAYDPCCGDVLRLVSAAGGRQQGDSRKGDEFSSAQGTADSSATGEVAVKSLPTPTRSLGLPKDVPPPSAEQLVGDLDSVLLLRRLPASVASGDEAAMYRRLQALRAVVEACYRDRLEPTLGELGDRLRACGWTHAEVRAAPVILARDPAFRILAPAGSKPVRILLEDPPAWFAGWTGEDFEAVEFTDEVWAAFTEYLEEKRAELGGAAAEVRFDGGIRGAALSLRQCAWPVLQHLSLGELRELLRQAAGTRRLLTFEGHSLRFLCPRHQ